MGYDLTTIRISLRLDNHFGPETTRDKAAKERLMEEITALVDADPEYSQIVTAVW